MRAQQVAETFVELSDTLAKDFDLPAFLDLVAAKCVELLEVAASGLIVVDSDGKSNLVAASTEAARVLQSAQIAYREGPSVECLRRAEQVDCADLGVAAQRWPRFVPAAQEAGFGSVYALPMSCRAQSVGALNLFGHPSLPLTESIVRLARSLADVVTIALLQERALRRQATLTSQLQSALSSRVSVEQAKGLLAGGLGIDLDSAFNTMRGFARTHNLKLGRLAGDMVADQAMLEELKRWSANG